MSMNSYLVNNNIGGLGCKYLSRASLSSIQNLWLCKSVAIKWVIMLEARESSTSPKRSGVWRTGEVSRFSVYVIVIKFR
jgi:hypothetical protein